MVETLAKGSRTGDSGDMEARIAVLEQIAADTRDSLAEIKGLILRLEQNHRGDFQRLEENHRSDSQRLEENHRSDFRRLEDHHRSDFRLLLSGGAAATIGLAALMAHGFHWF